MKKILLLFAVAMIMTFGILNILVTPAEALSVRIDGNIVSMDVEPFIDDNGRTMVPVRFVSETLAAAVEWDANSRTVTVTKGATLIKLVIGSQTITVNGTANTMDAAAVLRDGRTFVPVRYIAEALGLDVGWDGLTSTVILSSGNGSIDVFMPVLTEWKEFVDSKLDNLNMDYPNTGYVRYTIYDPGSEANYKFYYAILDLDNNGTDELLIACSGYETYEVKGVYSYVNGKLNYIFDGKENGGFWARNPLYVCENGYFRTFGQGGADSFSTTVYKLSAGGLAEIVAKIGKDGDIWKDYPKGTVSSEAEYEKLSETYKEITIEWLPLNNI